jgi:hypothetical protein
LPQTPVEQQQTNRPPPPNYQAPAPPVRESVAINDVELNQLIADLERTEAPPAAAPGAARSWVSARPSNEAIRARNKILGVISDKWRTGFEGFNISFRALMGNNHITASEGVSNWFAACGTLSGLYDQVRISQDEVRAKQGYWDQFTAVYGRKDVSVFNDFHFDYLETQLDENDGWEIATLMDYFGPIIIISKEKDMAVVVAELDYQSVAMYPYRVYYFDPDTRAAGSSYQPVYGNTNYDRTMTEFRSLIYRLRAHGNNGPVSVYIVVDNSFDFTSGVNQRDIFRKNEQSRALMRAIKRKGGR